MNVIHNSFYPRGRQLLDNARLNKDAAFTEQERDQFGLRGLLPHRVLPIEEQAELEIEHLRRKNDDIEKYICLESLRDRNEVLYYRVLVEHLEELLPIVYTPTVGQACQQFSHILRRPHGIWITPNDVNRIPELLRNASSSDIRLIVVTDNERILGLGDQGAGGMGIPRGKIALYCAGAGLEPRLCLPISLDVGTNNMELLSDPLYCGYRRLRLQGAAYEKFIDAFVEAVIEVFPRGILQWEDFHKDIAFANLERYRHRLPSFNDDIQGTAAIGVAGILNALKITRTSLADQRILHVGAGAAAMGIGRLIRMLMQSRGVRPEILRHAQLFVDTHGLVHCGRSDLSDNKKEIAVDHDFLTSLELKDPNTATLADIVRQYRPTILIGTTAKAGVFTEQIIREMARHVDRLVIFAFSNPTSKSECKPKDAIHWTDGRAIVATGSPFPPVEYKGRKYIIGQGNNVFIFPGLGLGSILSETHEINDRMFLAAALALAEMTDSTRLSDGALYPGQQNLRDVSFRVACSTMREARAAGIGREVEDDRIEDLVGEAMWYPRYVEMGAESSNPLLAQSSLMPQSQASLS